MAEAILLTGKRGEGKTLAAVMLAKRYLSQGRLVATNVDFNVEYMVSPTNRTSFIRLPDAPTSDDLLMLPVANSSYDESKNGLLLLDEVSGLLNSHDWRREDTKYVRFWLSQSRKYGWDLLFIAQDVKQIDAQIRNSLFEMHGIARNIGKIGIPFFSFFAQYFFGYKLRLPNFHVLTQRYGFQPNAALASTEIFSGESLFKCYDTKQKIDVMASDKNSTQVFGSAMATMLSAYHVRGRYLGIFAMYGKIAFLMLVFGFLIGAVSGYFYKPVAKSSLPVSSLKAEVPVSTDAQITGFITDSGKQKAYLTNGKVGNVLLIRNIGGINQYLIDGAWYQRSQ